MSSIRVTFPQGPGRILEGTVTLPSSKSVSNRVLMIEAMCGADLSIGNLSDAGDTTVMQQALAAAMSNEPHTVVDAGDAGTVFRFMLAFLCTREGRTFMLTGSERLQERPIAPLVDALRSVGARIRYLDRDGYAPLEIEGTKLKGGKANIDGSVSSQFISAMCLVAPSMQNGLDLTILNESVSASYTTMTLMTMASFGILFFRNEQQIQIAPQAYRRGNYEVENDWSSAAFIYAMAMLSRQVRLNLAGLREDGIQGESFITEVAANFGILSSFDESGLWIEKSAEEIAERKYALDLKSYPDMAISLIVVCAMRYPQVVFSGLGHLQFKESDRLQVLKTELAKADILMLIENDIVSFNNTQYLPSPRPLHFNTAGDHRIAMALSLFALDGFEVYLDDADCVKKSFPAWWEEWVKLGGVVERIED